MIEMNSSNAILYSEYLTIFPNESYEDGDGIHIHLPLILDKEDDNSR